MSSASVAHEYPIRSFLEEEVNLDIMSHLSRGLSFGEVAEKVGKSHSFVQSKCNFLRNHGIMLFGRWNVDVNALDMVKTIHFHGYNEKSLNVIFEWNFFLSYLSQIKMGEAKYLAMYTFPNEIKDRIGSEEITSWYFTFPHFEVPFHKDLPLEEEFFKLYEEEDNDDPLPPRGEKIKDPDLVDIYICRFAQQEVEEIDLTEFTIRIEEEIGDIVDVSYDGVKDKFQNLKEKHVIYPIIPFDFTELSFVSIYFITYFKEIFRVMKTLNRFNILTGISFMEENKNLVFVQCPYNKQNEVIQIFDNLDEKNKMFFVTKTYVNRGFPYRYYLEKFK